MAIATTLQKHLADQGVEYDVLEHDRTMSATRTAQTSHVSGESIAKAVLLKGDEGYMLAVVPATHHIQLGELQHCLDKPVGLATEDEVGQVFADCDLGAIPAAGAAYGLDVVLDDSLAERSEIYFEGGDHTSLVHVKGEHFKKLMANAQHARFSHHD
jgi:Ala-tRNA(Pro) deacylase